MPLLATLAAGFQILKPLIQQVGSIVCNVGSQVLGSVGQALSSNSMADMSTSIHEPIRTWARNDAESETIMDEEVQRQKKTFNYAANLARLGIPHDLATKMVDKIRANVEGVQSISTNSNIQITVLPYTNFYDMNRDDANYIPITNYCFRESILTQLKNYDYVLPLFLLTEIKNISDNSGLRLDVAVTTAFTPTWTQMDATKIMDELQPLPIDNKASIYDLQCITTELYKTYSIGEIKEKYPWLAKKEVKEFLFKDKYEGVDESDPNKTYLSDENGVTIKERDREDCKWMPYDLFLSQSNGLTNRNPYCDSCSLITGYAIRPRVDAKAEAQNDIVSCRVSVQSNMIALCIKNAPNIENDMLFNPKDIKISYPDGGKMITLEKEKVQEFASKKALAISNPDFRPTVMLTKTNAQLFNQWNKQAVNKNLSESKRKEYDDLIRNGICLTMAGRSNDDGIKGFKIIE